MNYAEYKKALGLAMQAKDDLELRRELSIRYEKVMNEKNFTVVETAEHFGIAYGTYYKLIKGKPLQIEVLCKLIAQL